MKSKLRHLVPAILFIACCKFSETEVRMSQLTAKRYYSEERRDGVLYKTHYYFKPTIYMFNSKPYTGRVKEYTDKNEVKSEGKMKDGFPDGIWVYYNSNGSVKSEGNFKNGVKDSLWRDYYNDGSPKVQMYYTLKNDSLLRDTIGFWLFGGKKIVETIGDTLKHYYKDGRLQSKVIKGENYLEEDYYVDGTIIYRKDKRRKESYYTNGKLRSRTYYLQDKNQLVDIMAEKTGWTKEEKDALTKADSVQFDYSSLWDPVMKIYVKE